MKPVDETRVLMKTGTMLDRVFCARQSTMSLGVCASQVKPMPCSAAVFSVSCLLLT